jgi:hypothetical protein
MHPNSLKLMEYFINKYLKDMKGCTVLDVGARKVRSNQETYRELFKDYQYTGMDIVVGSNVDIVGYENIKVVYDVVISGQTIEHVEQPWEFLTDLKKYFKTYICIIAPWHGHEHRYPVDTFRYLPDGMRALFKYAGIKELEISKDKIDTIGIGGR